MFFPRFNSQLIRSHASLRIWTVREVSGICPWATGARAVRALLGLQEVVGMTVCDGQSDNAWVTPPAEIQESREMRVRYVSFTMRV